MVNRNPYIAQLKSGYLFPEIKKRVTAYREKNPDIELINLGIGDTTQPLTTHLTASLTKAAVGLGTHANYSGYGDEQGDLKLRESISQEIYHSVVDADDIFISDGAKCDVGRLQVLFGQNCRIAVQNPTYPVYPDTGVTIGQSKIVKMDCTPENDFFPNLNALESVDIIYWCSPNNPTGSVSTREKLKQLIEYAKANEIIIIFDAAYAAFIQDPHYPRSIYEIEGADKVAIEIGSFSKMAGFTGVRLSWSVVSESLQFSDGISVKKDWKRVTSTFFNGASNIAQKGGIAVLDQKGRQETRETIAFYLENATILKNALVESDFEVYGGEHAPYLWVKMLNNDSWDAFAFLLEKLQLVTTPGSGFGDAGQGFVRFSAFGYRSDIAEAAERLKLLGESHDSNEKKSLFVHTQ